MREEVPKAVIIARAGLAVQAADIAAASKTLRRLGTERIISPLVGSRTRPQGFTLRKTTH